MVGSAVSPRSERALLSSQAAPPPNWLTLCGAGRTHRSQAEPREGVSGPGNRQAVELFTSVVVLLFYNSC